MIKRMGSKGEINYVIKRKKWSRHHWRDRDGLCLFWKRKRNPNYAAAMKILGITKANVLGVSQGGMIAQYLAIDYPGLVDKLVLTVTLSKQNKDVQAVVANMIKLAEQGNHKELMIYTAEKSYSENYLKKYRLFYPLLGRIGKPKDYSRFLIQAASCVQHNTYEKLENIVCTTLIIGGEDDKIVGVAASVELADKIKDSELFIYKGLGHAVYEEAKDFNYRVMSFLSR